MGMNYAHLSTGLPGLDQVLSHILPGDNIVWQVNTVDEYRQFVLPYCQSAFDNEQVLVYFRFGTHDKIVPDKYKAQVHHLHPENGFESFD